MKHIQLPSGYQFLRWLGGGGFGQVLECLNVSTQDIVAMKVQERNKYFYKELCMLRYLKKKNTDSRYIVQFIEQRLLKNNMAALVFERLDINLYKHIFQNPDKSPLDVQDIRSIIHQLATVLDTLKTLKVIHTDIKLDNIMVVDGKEKPLQIKLIDFGLSLLSEGNLVAIIQTPRFRAPEVILGLPFTEAVDMWSVGIVISLLLHGISPFAGKQEDEILCNMVDILGFPPDHELEAGIHSYKYFNKTWKGKWHLSVRMREMVKTKELYGHDKAKYPHPTLNYVDAEEREQCNDLLQQMLRWNADERITPSQVLTHPFITRGIFQQSSDIDTVNPGTRQSEKPGTPEKEKPETTETEETGSPETEVSVPSPTIRSILVKSAPPECCFGLDEDSRGNYDGVQTGSPKTEKSTPSPTIRSILVKSALESETSERGSTSETSEQGSTTLEDTDLVEEEQQQEMTVKKKKKKKNPFIRFCGWLRKKVSCCTCASDVLD
ncbi:serine/threonine-protein kinase ppk15-like isoform X2 [Notolabrus celidotus]|uniref:serine/threonine-protein kinase ppk15-like isoform X2 n=1 Tax=Notolabrus celidotus TaxID=1203425 RepID=UPI001490722C|nr:serine/threonine-protein kinase ppk15-like isoform X2 [Notolabrus celidotus]